MARRYFRAKARKEDKEAQVPMLGLLCDNRCGSKVC